MVGVLAELVAQLAALQALAVLVAQVAVVWEWEVMAA